MPCCVLGWQDVPQYIHSVSTKFYDWHYKKYLHERNDTFIVQFSTQIPCNCTHRFARSYSFWMPLQKSSFAVVFNPQHTVLIPICKSQLAELFCGVFKFSACFLKNLNISRTKRDTFVKQKAICGEGIRHCSGCLKNAVMSLLYIGEHTFLKKF